MKVKRIGHVGIRARDVPRMMWFLRDVLGLEPMGDQTATFHLPTHPSIWSRFARRIFPTSGEFPTNRIL
jgi:catechol 2,3-dioxygenase-like lactoylglutathione lyase family enzyme